MALSPEHQQRLQIFQEITQISDVPLCTEILEQNGWNVDVAVENFVQGRSSQPRTDSSSRNRPRTEVADEIADEERRPAGFIDYLWNPLRWIFQVRPVSLNPSSDTRKFISEFDDQFPHHPNFRTGSYQSAVLNAFQTSKFLLVYIHSPMHEDTDRFCRQVLCTQNVSRFLDENFVTWAGRVWDPEAYGLSTQLRASSYPFMALLICQSERTVQVADRIQGVVGSI